MCRSHLPALLSALCVQTLLLSTASAAPEPEVGLTQDEVRIHFEWLAARLTYLPISAVLYDRPSDFLSWTTQEIGRQHRDVYLRIKNSRFSSQALQSLLAHNDPKVRTLALAAVFDRCDARLLPAIAALRSDLARTFDGHPTPISKEQLAMSGIGPPPLEQTVASFADKMIERYTHGVAFDEYWKTHGSRTVCAGWFAVKLERARQGARPLQKDRAKHVATVHHEIDQLPGDDRTWTLLRLYEPEFNGDGLITERELVEQCAALGNEKLLLLLEGKIPSDDPDLQWRRDDYPYARSRLFVLRHATTLLKPTDSPRLKACEPLQATPWWAIARAELNPHDASAILREALPRYQERHLEFVRADIPATLWRLGGDAENGFIREWFFQSIPDLHSHPNCRVGFLRRIFSTDQDRGKVFLSEIIADPRFDELDVYTTEEIAQRITSWISRPISKRSDFFVGPKDLDVRLAAVRNRIRDSVPLWLADD